MATYKFVNLLVSLAVLNWMLPRPPRHFVIIHKLKSTMRNLKSVLDIWSNYCKM